MNDPAAAIAYREAAVTRSELKWGHPLKGDSISIGLMQNYLLRLQSLIGGRPKCSEKALEKEEMLL